VAGLIKEVWRKEIIGSLFKGNEFLRYSVNADEFVKDGTIVHIPQSGIPSNVEVDRASLPATVSERTDTDIVYTLKELTSDPKLIKNIDKYQLSYDKMQSVIREDMANIKEKGADWILRLWAPASGLRILRTTGAAVVAGSPGATGNRKAFVKEDLKRARLQFNKDKVSKEGRYALIPSDMMDALLSDPDLLKRDSSMELDMKNGVVTRLYGFNLIDRADVIVYDNAGTPVAKNPGVAGAATDNQAVLCWQQDQVECALGNVEPFYKIDDPTYYGSIFSFLVMIGGRNRRADNKGILAIVEAASA
jgi:hypothetical protein